MPPEQPRVEGAGSRQIVRAKLQMDDGVGGDRRHLLLCLTNAGRETNRLNDQFVLPRASNFDESARDNDSLGREGAGLARGGP
jgi:hypothetical protein